MNMDRNLEVISKSQDTALRVAETIYGDAAWEISKALTAQQKRREARIGLASNVVGTAAGVAATGAAYKGLTALVNEKKHGTYTPKHAIDTGDAVSYKPRHAKPMKFGKLRAIKSKHAIPVAAAALGLQVANNAGDVVAAKVLTRESRKKVAKLYSEQRPASESEMRTLRKKRPIRSRLQPVKYKAGWAYADDDGYYGLTPGKDRPNLGPGIKRVDKFSRYVGPREIHKADDAVDFIARAEISKMDTDKRQVFGWASIIEINGEPVVDYQEDVMTIETIEKAAYDYVKTSRKGGNQHQREGDEPRHVSDMIESFLVTKEKKAQMGLPDSVPTGWWVGFQVNDEDTWQEVKNGKKRDFSIHGSGIRKEVEV